MIESEVGIAIGCLRVVSPEHSFLDYDTFGLQVDRLQEVTKFELD